jgi:hypothetical protein
MRWKNASDHRRDDRGRPKRALRRLGVQVRRRISPIGQIRYRGEDHFLGGNSEKRMDVIGPLTQKLYDTLTGIQWGSLPDPFGWVETVCCPVFPILPDVLRGVCRGCRAVS